LWHLLWLFGWLAAAAIAVTAPALVASDPAEAQTLGMELGNHDGKDGAWVGECGA